MTVDMISGHWLLAEADRIPAEGPRAWGERIGREHSGDVDGLLRLLSAGPEELQSEVVLALRAVGAEVSRVPELASRLVFRVVPAGGDELFVVAPDTPLPGEPAYVEPRAESDPTSSVG